MATVQGPDFIALQVPDLERSARFYADIIGLPMAPDAPPDAVVFLTSPISFAVRTPRQPLGTSPLGHGFVLWLRCDNVHEMYAQLKRANVTLLDEPTPGPFGTTFRFQDPDGYIITMHGIV